MYLDKDSKGRFHVMDIDKDTLHGLRRMIEGACLEQRRTFNGLLEDIKMEEKLLCQRNMTYPTFRDIPSMKTRRCIRIRRGRKRN